LRIPPVGFDIRPERQDRKPSWSPTEDLNHITHITNLKSQV
jgi:hypothetical protein